ncbi:MAG: IS30 family transposase [Rickettsiaceae bacterium]|nr:IS30 family transposase [Rickettsiaceae bacterium]
MSYKQLTYAKRCNISAFIKAGYNNKEISKEINVHPSTISREIKRNSRWNGKYDPDQAAACYKYRRKHSRKPRKVDKELAVILTEKIKLDWSPEQISGYGKKFSLFEISHETIYQFVLYDKKNGGELYRHLRHGKKRNKKRYGSSKQKSCAIKNRIFIDERPAIVDSKERVGDWEADTIIGKNQKGAIVTLVERKSKLTLISNVISKKSEEVYSEIIRLLKPYKDKVFTITSDSGTEFAWHDLIAKELDADFYFAHPYSSWERGLNEHTNGMIRQYIPKGSDFKAIDGSNSKTGSNFPFVSL